MLLAEAALGLLAAIQLSILAGEYRVTLSGEAAVSAEVSTRFAAAGAFILAIGAVVAVVGVRRRRAWSWSLAALLQLIMAVGAALAMVTAGEEGITVGHLLAIGLAGLAMLLLSTPQVRRALGQG